MNLCRFDLYVGLLCIVFKCCLAANDYENTNCKTSGVVGKCKLVPNCPVALESLKRTQTHNLKRCGFDGLTEVVCCPSLIVKKPSTDVYTSNEGSDDNSNTVSRFTKRRCEQACEELSNKYEYNAGFNIIGGENASIKDFPHMGALGYKTEEGIEWDCSASVISKRYLVTAAHCIANKRRIRPSKVRLGVTKLNETNPQDYTISNITVNPKYDPSTKHNDIALLKVDQEIKFSEEVYPACLYVENNDPLGLIITGWGKTTIGVEDDRSNILQKAILVAVPVRECNITYFTRSSGTNPIVGSQICAGSASSDACWGDSGGPLQIQNTAGSYSIVGIISYGTGCGGKSPGVYTRVSKFLDWIESVVWT